MDLTTTYLGLKLKSPVVPSASPLTADLDNIRKAEDAGAGAVVLPSIFEEQLVREQAELVEALEQGTESYAEALSYFPNLNEYRTGPEEYLELIRKAKNSVQIPVIASLNGVTPGGWTTFARQLEQAGADAIELNIYFIPTDPDRSSDQIEQVYVDILSSVRQTVNIPVAVKLSPFFTNMASMARRLERAGASGLVLFNRFYQPDINLENLEVEHTVLLSTPQARRLPLRWIAILYGRVHLSLAATSGIHSGEDAIKMIMAGASVTMLCSALLKRGMDHIRTVIREMEQWMHEHEYESVQQMLGTMSQQKCPDPSAYERAQYMRILTTFKIESSA